MLSRALNINGELPPDWNCRYGISSDRLAALLDPYPERNSFQHPGSETALTLFMLGNIDGWKQLIAEGESPRNEDKWNHHFFDGIRAGNGTTYSGHTLWSVLREPFCDGSHNWEKSVLLFEFEIMNSAFHSVNGRVFKDLSFLDIKGNRRWGAFDAFLIVPTKDAAHKSKGLLIGFESKFGSDISHGTKGFPHVNQIMRNLEAGYWLTHHRDSNYREWIFKYVFLCPRIEFTLGTRLYSWMLRDSNSRRQALADYRNVLLRHVEVEATTFADFANFVDANVTVLHWDELAHVVSNGQPDFWDNYCAPLNGVPEYAGLHGATRQRLTLAGINLPAM